MHLCAHSHHSVLKQPDLNVTLLLVLGNAARGDEELCRQDAERIINMLKGTLLQCASHRGGKLLSSSRCSRGKHHLLQPVALPHHQEHGDG